MRAIVIVGLGFGDESKGSTTDALCRRYKVGTVIRYSGGLQCGHNVTLEDGRSHTFSQFSAGTFAGAQTYLARQVIIDPLCMAREAKHLMDIGITEPYSLMFVHPKCLVSTIYHQYLNRQNELSVQHGSCGMGIGETRNYWLQHGNESVYAEDLLDIQILCDKLELIRQRTLIEFDKRGLTRHANEVFTTSVLELARLYNKRFKYGIQLYDHPRITETTVFEGAQGVLLDEWHGFHPHTTWSTTTPHFAIDIARAFDMQEIHVVGLTRAYTTRHGTGPLPTYDKELTERFPDTGNPHNNWQGGFRYGWLDLPLLEYAVNVCANNGGIDSIGLSHIDQIGPDYKACHGYEEFGNHIPINMMNLAEQNKINCVLEKAKPQYTTGIGINEISKALELMRPISIVSKGPSSANRKIWDLPFREMPKSTLK